MGMSDDTPVVTRDLCPGCEPDYDPRALIEVRFCHRHEPDRLGIDDGHNKVQRRRSGWACSRCRCRCRRLSLHMKGHQHHAHQTGGRQQALKKEISHSWKIGSVGSPGLAEIGSG